MLGIQGLFCSFARCCYFPLNLFIKVNGKLFFISVEWRIKIEKRRRKRRHAPMSRYVNFINLRVIINGYTFRKSHSFSIEMALAHSLYSALICVIANVCVCNNFCMCEYSSMGIKNFWNAWSRNHPFPRKKVKKLRCSTFNNQPANAQNKNIVTITIKYIYV